jgi:hypothetical protein
MKTFNFFISMAMIIVLASCTHPNNEVLAQADVETYIGLLKSNQYDSLNLPSLTPSDIPALLQYRNERQIITNFPHNFLSSYHQPDCSLGMYVLWTIESIRAVAIESEYLTQRFPSLNPVLAHRNSPTLDVVSDSVSHTIAADAYFNWWEDNKKKDFGEFKFIDPLENTAYKWH